MVLRVDVVEAALRARYGVDPVDLREQRRVIALTPGGRLLDDALADTLAGESDITLLCGRYEGFDQRVIDHFCTEELSIGRYVLAGGELAAMVVADTVLRKLPGSLGHADSADGGVLQPGARGRAGVPALHAAGRLARLDCARRAAFRAPRADPRMAARAEPSSCRGSATIGRRFRGGSTPADALLVMSTVIDSLERAQLRRVPRFQSGDRVKVHFQVVEGTRRRTQVFEGVVIKRQGEGVRETFTVRKQSFGVGVERTFPVHSPKIERIEVAARGDVRRAKLYYLRGRVGKRARVRERRYTGQAEEVVEAGLLHDPAAAAAAAADAEVPGEAVDAQALEEAPETDAAAAPADGGDDATT